MKTVKLGDIISLQYGKALKKGDRRGGSVAVVGSSGVVGFHDHALSSGPTIVVGRKGSIGSVTWVPGDVWPIDTAYEAVPRGEGVDLRWLYWILGSLGLEGMNKSAAVPGLNRDDVYRLSIRLPDLKTQKCVAEILDRADEQRSRRRAQITHLMDLRSTVFEYLFPSPGKNVRPLGEVAAVSSGITKGRKVKEAVREVPYMAVANVQAGSLDLTAVKTIAATEAEISKYELREGDLLLTEGGDPDKLGRGTVWRGELPLALHQNHIFRVRLPEEGAVVIPEYLESYVASHAAKSYFLRSAKQTTGIASINSTQLKALPVPVPPFSVQREFAAVVAKVDEQRERIERALALEDELFASLQYRAFRGEL